MTPGDNFGRLETKAHRHLTKLALQHTVDEDLTEYPRHLSSDSPTNKSAFAHAMRLASYEYPLAYGRGYKHFPVSRLIQHLGGSTLLGIGVGRHLRAGLVASHIDPEHATIDFLLRSLTAETRAPGRRLLLHYLQFARNERSYNSIDLEVVNRNHTARDLYTYLGFVETARIKGQGHSIVCMELPSKESIDRAIKKLHDRI